MMNEACEILNGAIFEALSIIVTPGQKAAKLSFYDPVVDIVRPPFSCQGYYRHREKT